MSLSVGIIGLGKVGQLRYRLLAERRDVKVVSYFDPRVPRYAGLVSRRSAEAVLQDGTVNAVFVCTPNYLMRNFVSTALRHNKHVFCEKPAGISVADALAMKRAQARHPSKVLKFGFNHRYMSHYETLKKLIVKKRFGKLLWLRGVYGKGYDATFYSTWRSDKKKAGGGVLIDQGIHLLDLLCDLGGELNVVGAQCDRLHWRDANVEDNVFAILRSAASVPVAFQSSMVHWKHTLRLEVATERALLVMEGVKSATRSYGDEVLHIHRDWKNSFVHTESVQRNETDFYTMRKEIDEFVRATQGKRAIVCGTVDDALRVMKLIEKIYTIGR